MATKTPATQESATTPSLALEDIPDVSGLVTEDDTPVDNIYSEKQQRLFQDPLNSSWREMNGGRAFVSMTNVGLFYGIKQPPVVPDGLLSLDVELPADLMEKKHRSYFMWEYAKPPEYILEIVSNLEGEELGKKKQIYAQIGVLYYVVWDPAGHLKQRRLQAFVLHGKKYKGTKDLWFPEIELGVTIWHGPYEESTQDWLRWCDRHGKVLPTAEEGRQAERKRADLERKRAERLAAKLRAFGVEPDSNGK